MNNRPSSQEVLQASTVQPCMGTSSLSHEERWTRRMRHVNRVRAATGNHPAEVVGDSGGR